MITTNKEILDTFQTLVQVEQTIWGQLMFGTQKFRQAHNALDIRVAGLEDKMKVLREKYFVIVNGQVQFDEVPADKEGDKPIRKVRLNKDMKEEDYKKELDELLNIQIQI